MGVLADANSDAPKSRGDANASRLAFGAQSVIPHPRARERTVRFQVYAVIGLFSAGIHPESRGQRGDLVESAIGFDGRP